jgi:hypothetical protein
MFCDNTFSFKKHIWTIVKSWANAVMVDEGDPVVIHGPYDGKADGGFGIGACFSCVSVC